MVAIKFPDGTEVKLDCSDAEAQLLQKGVDAVAERADSAEDKYDNLFDQVMKLDEDDKEMSIEDKMKKLKKDMAEAGEDKKKLATLQGQYDALKKEHDKSKEKMDSAIADILADFDLAKKVKTDMSLRADSGEIKTTEDMFSEALQHVDKEIKLDSVCVDTMRGMVIVHAETESMKRQRGTRQDAKNPMTFAEMQKQASNKHYEG